MVILGLPKKNKNHIRKRVEERSEQDVSREEPRHNVKRPSSLQPKSRRLYDAAMFCTEANLAAPVGTSLLHYIVLHIEKNRETTKNSVFHL